MRSHRLETGPDMVDAQECPSPGSEFHLTSEYELSWDTIHLANNPILQKLTTMNGLPCGRYLTTYQSV